jgi:hypothetical protein
MEYWNDGLRGRKRTVLFFPLLIPTIPTFHHSTSPADYAQGQRFSPGIQEAPGN